MCVICIKPKDRPLPEKEHLINCDKANSDGIGLCYWNKDSNVIRIKKDFKDSEQLYKYLKRKVKNEDSLIIHFRKATSGLVDEGNRHPFPVTKDEKIIRKPVLNTDMAIAHNGVFVSYEEDKTFSDTQQFIMHILGNKAIKENIREEYVRALINKFIGFNKISIMLDDGDIIMFGDYIVIDNDIIYSNDSFKEKTIYYYNSTANKSKNYNTPMKNNTEQKQIGFKGKENNKGNETITNDSEICEGCSTIKKNIKTIKFQHSSYKLCKDCRKKYGKGELKLEPKQDLEQCGSCRHWFSKKELTNTENTTSASILLCDKCLEEYLKNS